MTAQIELHKVINTPHTITAVEKSSIAARPYFAVMTPALGELYDPVR